MIAYTLVSLFLFFSAIGWYALMTHANNGKPPKPDCFSFLCIFLPVMNFVTALPVAWIIKWSSGL